MEVFINEVSLEGQYISNTEFAESIKNFITILTDLKQKIQDYSIYKDTQTFLSYEAIKNQSFQQSLNSLRDKSQKRAFTNILFNKINPIEWRSQRIHSASDNFDCLMFDKSYKNIQNTSLAEVAERKLQNNTKTYLIINFVNSSFKIPHHEIKDCYVISIIKNNDEHNLIDLEGIHNKSGLINWINKISINYIKYDHQSQIPPRDEQTILSNIKKFKKTMKKFQGRIIYHEINYGRYWYVDNLHYGKAAHIEVFDGNGQHIGEASLEGLIDFSKQDPNKRINL